MKLKGIKAVLFDLFDTLLLIERMDEDIGEKCMRNVYDFISRNGVNVSYEVFRKSYSDVRKQIYEGPDTDLREPHFCIRISKTLQELGYKHDENSPLVRGAAEAYMEEFARHIHMDADAIPILRKLRGSGYKTGIVSNFSIPEGARKLIAVHGLEGFFDTIVISGEINRRKPSPEIFIQALNNLKVNAPKAVFIGDTPKIDIEGAKRVGMKTILIRRKNAKISTAESKPDFIVSCLKEILEIL
ncbi:MAG: HAD family hydrolase [Candidatus Bathyarchaeia archaeon]